MPNQYDTAAKVQALVEATPFPKLEGQRTEDEYRMNSFMFVLDVLLQLYNDKQAAWGVLRKKEGIGFDRFAADVLVRRTPNRDMEVYDIVSASEAPTQAKTWIQHPNRTDVENWTSYEEVIYGTPIPQPIPRDDFEQLAQLIEREADELHDALQVIREGLMNLNHRISRVEEAFAIIEAKLDRNRNDPREIVGPFGLKGVLL